MKRAVAFDVGSQTIGIAQSDPLRMYGHPVQTLRTQEKQWAHAMASIADLLVIGDIDTYIIGLPLTLKNKESASTLRAKRFGQAWKKYLISLNMAESQYKIIYLDERFSTKSAEHYLVQADMKRKARKHIVDTVAAVIILNNYLASEKMNGKEEQ